MSAAQYVSSNRQCKSMGRLPIYVYGSSSDVAEIETVSKLEVSRVATSRRV